MNEFVLIRAVDLFCQSHQEGEAIKDQGFKPPKALYRMWLRVDKLAVVVSIFVGKRGGVYEELIVIDPNQTIEADRLAIHNVYPSDFDFEGLEAIGLVDRSDLKAMMLTERDGEAAIPIFLNGISLDASLHPISFKKKLLAIRRQSSPQPPMVYGGLPSLGRRSR